MKYAYYIVETDSIHGDKEYSQGLKELYFSFGTQKSNDKISRELITSYDGVSRFMSPQGAVITRVIIRNIFTGKPFVFDIEQA